MRALLVALCLLFAAPVLAQDFAQRVEMARQADVNSRVNAIWDTLANDPAAPVIGNPHGDVIIVEFFDYTCPYCKAAEPRLLALVAKDKRIKLVLKEFPILAPVSLVASRAALAADMQRKYERFHRTMMRHEGLLTEADVMAMAKASGLDMARLKRDMNGQAVDDQIIAVFNQARAIRVFQTPGYIVGGAKGAHVLGSESAAIDFGREVAKARGR